MKKKYSKREPIKDYFPLPNEIFYLNLSYGKIEVYVYLLHCENRKSFQCYPSYKTIGEALNMSRNTVCKYVRALEGKESITTELTNVLIKKGEKLNGNILYTILPIEQAKRHYYNQQLKNIDRVIEDSKHRKRIEKFNLQSNKEVG